MTTFSTAISALGGVLSKGAGGVLSAINAISPLVGPGIQLAGQLGAFNGGRRMAQMVPYGAGGGAYAMPGGAPLFGGAMRYPSVASAGLFDLLPGGGGEIQPEGGILGFGRQRLPRIVMVPNPNNSQIIETYVKAPRVKYRVSIQPQRRRCRSGGR